MTEFPSVDTVSEDALASEDAHASEDQHISEAAFVEGEAIDNARDFLFPGDQGQLPYDARRAFALLLQKRFIEASEDPWAWERILTYQDILESRFHDMFLELVVDRDYSVAYKVQVRQEELNIPILLRDDSYKRAETVVLLYLRSTFRQQVGMGENAAFVDLDELVNHAMSFFASDETNLALRQREVSQGIDALAREGILKEASEGRFRISPIIEVLMPIERIKELTAWLEQRQAGAPANPATTPDEAEGEDEGIVENQDTDAAPELDLED